METRVQRWGNSLALRIPKPLADEAGLKDNSPVQLLLRDKQLVIVPVHKPALSLEALLAQVTEANLHREAGFICALPSATVNEILQKIGGVKTLRRFPRSLLRSTRRLHGVSSFGACAGTFARLADKRSAPNRGLHLTTTLVAL